jgi:hypothetical protein
MKLTLSADWKRDDESMFSYERELRIAGLFASVEFRGDVYEWRVREDSQHADDISSGWVDSFEEAEKASERAIEKHFAKEGQTT